MNSWKAYYIHRYIRISISVLRWNTQSVNISAAMLKEFYLAVWRHLNYWLTVMLIIQLNVYRAATAAACLGGPGPRPAREG